MDEILIEEKKYVSSKRAAAMTGYAKDYVGQLCREGRVPARLVGRNWYVLESAIKDHRFNGVEDTKANKVENDDKESKAQETVNTWEPTRYESVVVEPIFPSAQQPQQNEAGLPENLEESWREWFSHTPKQNGHQNIEHTQTVDSNDDSEPIQKPTTSVAAESVNEVLVPLHIPEEEPTGAQVSHYDHMATDVPVQSPVQAARPTTATPGVSRVLGSVQVFSILVAVLAVSLALFGSGYLDNYVSGGLLNPLAGITEYTRK